MKKLLMLLVAVLLSACSATSSKELVSTSADKKFQIKVKGNKPALEMSYTTEIIIIGNDMEDTLVTQIYISELNEKTVLFDWKDNENCQVQFIQSDNKNRVMNVSFANNTNYLKEVNK